MSDIKTLAEQLSKSLETRTRNNGEKFVCLKDDSPEWMREVVRKCHGDEMPNDTIYRFIEKCADAIAAVMEIKPDIYTADILDWAKNYYEYCDQYMNEMGGSYPGFVELARCAQSMHIQEIGAALVAALEEVSESEEE